MKKRLGRIMAVIGMAAVLCIALTVCMGPIGTNQEPVANFSTEPGDEIFSINFDGDSSFDPDGKIAFWKWWFGDGKTGNGVTVTHKYAGPGTISCPLARVQGNNGVRDEITKDVTVAPDPTVGFPIAVLYWLPAGKAQTGSEVTFVGKRSSDPDGSIEWAWWDFGDGEKENGPWTKMEQDAFGVWQQVPGMSVVTYTYVIPGKYVVSLMIMDNNGKTDSTSRTIRASYPPAPPP